MKTFLWALLLTLISAPIGFSQSVTPTAANQVNVTDGAGGYTLQPYGGGGSGSTHVIYASTVSGAHAGQAVIMGSSAVGDLDSAAVLNAVLAQGNVKLVLDSGFALSASLLEFSGDSIECTSRTNGVIMMVASNATPVSNAHQNAPTTASGTGGFVVSNVIDTNIAVHGCMLNSNATESATGTNSQGTAHAATPGGKFIYGVNFAGVNGFVIDNNEIYDTATWNVFITNVSSGRISNNYIHQPTPLVQSKFTDGVHCIGPCNQLQILGNRINCGDDCLALNADDGNRTGTGDPNSSYVQAFVKWGPITHVHANSNIFDAGSYGVRLLSATELIDDVSVNNTTGSLCGNTFTMQAAYPSIGHGNVGTVAVDGWNVPTDGTCNVFSQPFNWSITENYVSLAISNVSLTPGTNWPIITHNVVSPGLLSLKNFSINSPSSSSFSLFSFTGGAIPQTVTSGIVWNDNASNTGTVVAGTATPDTFTCSNYAGPNRLLAAGFVPTHSNGDCFTNTYTAVAVTYINTTFNEQTTGTTLAGTTPTTTTGAAAWQASSGGPSSGAWRYTTNSVTLSGSCTSGGPDVFCPVFINASVANYTLRVNVSQFDSGNPSGFSFVTRWTNNTNFVTFLQTAAGQWGLFDVVGGTTTQIGSSVNLGTSTGIWTVIMSGTTATLKNPAGTSMNGTISGSNTTNNVGVSSNLSSFLGSDIITSFSVKSF